MISVSVISDHCGVSDGEFSKKPSLSSGSVPLYSHSNLEVSKFHLLSLCTSDFMIPFRKGGLACHRQKNLESHQWDVNSGLRSEVSDGGTVEFTLDFDFRMQNTIKVLR